MNKTKKDTLLRAHSTLKKLPIVPLTKLEMKTCTHKLKVSSFRGIFMQADSHAIHVKWRMIVDYYDSYGNLRAPPDLKMYMRGMRIYYYYETEQHPWEWNCGHLCLYFLSHTE
ncbi:hypothetical protein PR048_011169 [Dryococelus australis]|uniref:Uncharacterized protein n=1 Tax=Dryococelus australis TaxID=614101 RepID=A0ABQ9HKV6_9NEOP|nr:hypothetical protein PR048_011169 [Dryococelus australis]